MRYWALTILGSRPWPFKVTWRHRSRDDSITHMGFPIGASLEPSPYIQAFSRYLARNISGSRPWPRGITRGHVTSLVIWPFDATYSISCRRSIVTDSLSPDVFEILGRKHVGVTTLTFQGHVTSSITWRFDSPYGVSYWCSIGSKSLSPSVFEIFGSKYFGVTTLTFQGHVTLLVMWPFDAPYSISYRRSIVTDSLSPAVVEILDPKHIGGHDLDLSRSRDVVDHVTILFPI